MYMVRRHFDYLKTDTDSYISDLLETCGATNSMPFIAKLTHAIHSSAILTVNVHLCIFNKNSTLCYLFQYTFVTDISYHLSIFSFSCLEKLHRIQMHREILNAGK